jgi:hypothetical protein
MLAGASAAMKVYSAMDIVIELEGGYKKKFFCYLKNYYIDLKEIL